MGVFDKIKNALFEEEYVEVEEKPKTKPKSKKDKPKREIKESIKVHENKPIAKKVVLPERREEVLEDLEEYEPEEEDFEIVPEREEKHDTAEFKFPAVDDQEFRDDEYYQEPKIVEVVDREAEQKEKESTPYRVEREPELYHGHVDSNLYSGKKDSGLYHNEYHSSVSIQEYGTYEKKEAKPAFKPSPIISPIYGILDKNYKKEEIAPKREVRLSSYTREHMNVDDIRRKAYGNLADDIAADIDGREPDFPVEEEVTEEEVADNLLVDLSNDDEKPKVSEVTVGDAEEYFRDLGLEYNIDYKDSSKEKATGRRVTEEYNEDEKVAAAIDTVEEKKNTSSEGTDDNLFDLIDSMYENTEEE